MRNKRAIPKNAPVMMLFERALKQTIQLPTIHAGSVFDVLDGLAERVALDRLHPGPEAFTRGRIELGPRYCWPGRHIKGLQFGFAAIHDRASAAAKRVSHERGVVRNSGAPMRPACSRANTAARVRMGSPVENSRSMASNG